MLDPHKRLQSYPASNHTGQIYFAFNCGCFPCPLWELLSSLPPARVYLWLCSAHRITEILGFCAWILCAAIYVISAKTFPISQRMWELPCWLRKQGSIQLSDHSWHPGNRVQAQGIFLPAIFPVSNHFLRRGFPEFLHVTVSTSLAKPSGNLCAAKPLATTRDINQAELESLTIIGKKKSVIWKTYMSFDLNLD